METKYDVDLPKTREEELSESYFEWVKTERAGDVSKFKELLVVDNVEYIVFQDNTRVNSSLIGDVVLKHKHSDEIMGVQNELQEHIEIEHKHVFTPHENAQLRQTVHSQNVFSHDISPVTSILEKSKKKKQKIKFEVQLDMPSTDVLNIIRDNFANSDDEIYEFFMTKIDKKKFVTAILTSQQLK